MTGNPELIEEYRKIHASAAYGTTSVKNLRFIRPEIQLLRPKSILDYGCGQSRLIDMLNLGYPADQQRYDPAIPAIAKKPAGKFDLLINVDVLEHIEESDLDQVIAEMRALSHEALIIIDTRPAKKLLSDGRNAHVTIRPHAWWKERLGRHFSKLEEVSTVRRSRAGFRTWSRKPGDEAKFRLMRAAEDARHLARRLTGQHKRDKADS